MVKLYTSLWIWLLCFGAGPLGAFSIQEQWTEKLSHQESFLKSFPYFEPFLAGKEDFPQRYWQTLSDTLPSFRGPMYRWGLFTLGMAEQKSYQGDYNPHLIALRDSAGNQLSELWVYGLKSYQLGESDWAFRFWEKCHRQMLIEGYQKIPEFALVLLKYGDDQWQKGSRQEAQKLLEAALWFDVLAPVTQIWQVSLGNSQLNREFSVVDRLGWVLREMPTQLKNIESQSILLLNFFYFLQGLVYVLIAVWVLYIMVFYLPHFFHRYTHYFPNTLPLFWRYAVFYGFLLVLPIFGVGWFFFTLLCMFVVWNILSKWDKYIGVIFLFLLFFSPVDILLEKSFHRLYDENAFPYLHQEALNSAGDQELLARIHTLAPKGKTQELMKNLALSVQYRKVGEYTEAVKWGEAALKIKANSPQALNNFGLLLFLLSKSERAEDQYKRALEYTPTQSALLFNLSQVYLFTNNSVLHAEYLKKATDQNPNLFKLIEFNDEYFLKGSGTEESNWPLAQRVQDMPFSIEYLFYDALEELKVKDWLQWHIPGAKWDIPPLLWPFFILLFSMLIWMKPSALVRYVWERGVVSCYSCGTLICQFCRQGAYCEDCHHQLSGIPQKSLKKDLILRLQKNWRKKIGWLGVFFNFLVPGLGIAYLESRLLGFLSILITVTFWALYLFLKTWVHYYPYPMVMGLEKLVLVVYIGWFVFQIGYGVLWAWMWSRKSKEVN